MNKIKIDNEKKLWDDSIMTTHYKYEFRCSIAGLDDNSRKEDENSYNETPSHNLQNMFGFEIDARDTIFEILAKDFLITLRRNIYREEFEKLLSKDLKHLIKIKKHEQI